MRKIVATIALLFSIVVVAGCSTSNTSKTAVSSDQKAFITKELKADSKKMIGVAPAKIKFSKYYQYEDNGIKLKVTYSNPQVKNSDLLKNSPTIYQNRTMDMYVDLKEKGNTKLNRETVQDELNRGLGRDQAISQFNNNPMIQSMFISDNSKVASSNYNIGIDSQPNVNYLITNYNQIQSMPPDARIHVLDQLPRTDRIRISITITPRTQTTIASEKTLLEQTLNLDNVPDRAKLYVDRTNSKTDEFKIHQGNISFKQTNVD
jgi:PBP1b-binding outer membrane lipoprotein LpoB